MSNLATLPIEADRYGACVRRIYVRGLDLTGVPMRAQVRLGGDVPGFPLVDLQTVTNGNAEGLRLVEVVLEATLPVSVVELVVNESTMEGLPYAGELGAATELAWDWQLTLAGRKQRIARGTFTVTGDGVTGADAAPTGRIAGWSNARTAGGMRTGATLTFGPEVLEVSIDGADLLAPYARSAQNALDRIEDFTRGDTGPANSTFLSLATLKAAPASNRSYNLVADGSVTAYAYVAGNFTGRADDLNVIKLDAVPIATGALVRQTAGTVNFDGRSVGAKIAEVVSVTDVRFAGGAKADAVYDAANDTVTGTDNTAAFTAALAAGIPFDVPAGRYRATLLDTAAIGALMRLRAGAWLYLEPGRYTSNGQALAGVRFRGGSCGIVGVDGHRAGCGVQLVGVTEANGVFFVGASGLCVVRGITIAKKPSGDVAIDDDTYQTGVSFVNATATNPGGQRTIGVLEDCRITGFAQYGWQHYGDLCGGAARRNRMEAIGRANQPISRGSGGAITRGVSRLTVESNEFIGCKEYGVFGSTAGLASDLITIVDNTITSCGRGGVSWTEEAQLGSVAGKGLTRLSVNNNRISGCGTDATYTTGRAEIRIGTYDGRGSIAGFEVKGNLLSGTTPYSILIQSNAADAARVSDGQVTGNYAPVTAATTEALLGIDGNVRRVVHANAFNGDPAKHVSDSQPNVALLPLQSGWGNAYGPPFKGTSYHRSPDGEVIIDYQLAGGSFGEPAFTMPAGLRPQFALVLPGGQGQLNANGTCVLNSGAGPFVGQVRFYPYMN